MNKIGDVLEVLEVDHTLRLEVLEQVLLSMPFGYERRSTDNKIQY